MQVVIVVVVGEARGRGIRERRSGWAGVDSIVVHGQEAVSCGVSLGVARQSMKCQWLLSVGA